MSERFGDWMQCASGRKFWPLDPRPEEVFIDDIAHHLAAINRFNGATRVPYSVAQHSVLVSEICPGAYSLWGLLHDAAEAYMSDIIRPVKSWLCIQAPSGLESIAKVEDRIAKAIATRFGYPGGEPSCGCHVHNADTIALGAERRDLMTPTDDEWSCLRGWESRIARVAKIEPVSFDIAKSRFLRRFSEIVVEPTSQRERIARAHCVAAGFQLQADAEVTR